MVRILCSLLQLALLSVLVIVPRCVNHEDVFVAGNIYFTDADCYARMTRVQMCAAHPGLVLRHHDFENYPEGITPHTTAPLDYLILGLAILLRPFTGQAIDLAGALISPLLALIAACFLWWWAGTMQLRYRWLTLLLFAFSPILVHGTALGRPDHQSLLILLIIIAVCSEWTLAVKSSRESRVISGSAWALALWVSLYEPLILFALVFLPALLVPGLRTQLFGPARTTGWICFVAIIAVAALVERRLPSIEVFSSEPFVRQWLRGIGELRPVPFWSGTWFNWAGYLVLLAPLILFMQRGKLRLGAGEQRLTLFLLELLGATFLLTMWQARWGYFFVTLFAIALPAVFSDYRQRWVVWAAFVLSLWPVARQWDNKCWPNEEETADRAGARWEQMNLRELALRMRGDQSAFLAPWWLSPSLAYWSGQPAVAGSSHESLSGIVASARFYAAEKPSEARQIIESREAGFVVAYEAARTAENCRQILGQPVGEHAVCYVLDRAPAQSPGFLVFTAQNSAGKLFRVANNR